MTSPRSISEESRDRCLTGIIDAVPPVEGAPVGLRPQVGRLQPISRRVLPSGDVCPRVGGGVETGTTGEEPLDIVWFRPIVCLFVLGLFLFPLYFGQSGCLSLVF